MKKRNKDQLKQYIKDTRSANASKVEKLEVDLKRAREAIEMVLDLYNTGYAFLSCESLEEDDVEVGIYLKECHVRQLQDALK